ncbi:hypothetical protein, partial [uncultured Brevundimonas sp.]|uniref:hypothetical protein n=1 Tax=uncultured Brevundimonas sp. TaxID=213418 RepID=UPI0025E2D268
RLNHVIVHAHKDQVIDSHGALPRFHGRLGAASNSDAVAWTRAIQNSFLEQKSQKCLENMTDAAGRAGARAHRISLKETP